MPIIFLHLARRSPNSKLIRLRIEGSLLRHNLTKIRIKQKRAK